MADHVTDYQLTKPATCTTILSAQLLRVQHEIRVPLEDCALARFSMSIPRDEILSAAKGVRRTCLQALRDQLTRLQSPSTLPFLPPPRFSVNFCPFALQLQRDDKKTKAAFQTLKVKRHDKHDDREICTYCNAQIPVAQHTGLPAYRWILFSSHLLEPSAYGMRKTTFACTGCNKTFCDSYGFLDHVFQKEIGSERSCQYNAWGGSSLSLNRAVMETYSDPVLVEKCLRNCLKRELTRARTLRKSKALEADGKYGLDIAKRPLTSAGTFRKRPTLASLSEDSASTLCASPSNASSYSGSTIRPMTSSGTLSVRERRPQLQPLASLSEDGTTTLVGTEPSVGSPKSYRQSFQAGDEWSMSAKLHAPDSILNRGRPVSDTPFFHTRSTRSSFKRRWLQEVD